MKKLLLALLLTALPLTGQTAEQGKGTPAASAKQQESRFTGSLFDALRNLSGMLPKQNGHKEANGQQTVATIGIRGNENTASLMTPYWKEDRAEDPAFQSQLQEYAQGQALLEGGRLKEAEQAIAGFIQKHQNSELLPNARFALALTYVGQDQKQKGREAMERFAADYPLHPLAADAQKIIPELK